MGVPIIEILKLLPSLIVCRGVEVTFLAPLPVNHLSSFLSSGSLISWSFNIVMNRAIALLLLICSGLSLAQSLPELEDEEYNEGFYNLVGGVQAVGKVARMVSALASALEILIYVILKNFVDLVIPPQYFNLLQIALYFSFDF